MDFSKSWLSIEEAKAIDMVAYLYSLGHEPTKIRNADYWYLSPLRGEKTPSFKINRKLNRWYDHGMGKGGNLIDFALLYNQCTVGEFLQKINTVSFHQPYIITAKQGQQKPESAESKISIIRERPLLSYTLCRYLHERRIPLAVADQFCKEITYECNGKEYYGIGFKNDAGGYEIRNPYFKASSSPKDITTIHNSAAEAIVFEGFMDFLSFIAIHKNQAPSQSDFVILNSVAFFEKARPFMEEHQAIRLYLDRDATGQNYSQRALSMSTKYSDESSLYKNHKDLNDWMVNFGKSQKKYLGQKLR